MVPRRNTKRPHAKKPKIERLTQGEINRVLEVLGRADAARRALDDARVDLAVTLIREKYDRVRRAHRAFFLAGGVSGDDWIAFLRGEPLRGCGASRPIPGPDCGEAQRYLRVVADNTKKRRHVRRVRTISDDTGPTAA